MIKKFLIVLLSIIFLSFTSCKTVEESGSLIQSDEPEEYDVDEFPVWLTKLRRAEIIFVGSIPFTILLSNIGYGVYGALSSDPGGTYAIENFTESGGLSNDERYDILKIGLSLSGAIALTDYIIGLVELKNNDE